MLHEDVQRARIELGLTRAELASRAGVPRERIRKLETGGNVTVETLTKVVAQLPNLKSLNLGGVQVTVGGVDIAALHEAIGAVVESCRRLLLLLQGVAPAPPPGEPVGATRFEPGLQVSPDLEARLRRLEALIHDARRHPAS